MEKLNQDKSIGFSLTKCPNHKHYDLSTIIVSKQVENNLVCFRCIQEMNISTQQTFHTSEILNLTDDNYIIPNFPPLNSDIHIFLNNQKNQQTKIDSIIENNNNFFDQLKDEIISAIQLIQNESKLKMSQLTELNQQIQDTYNEISSKQQLKQIFTENQNDKYSQIKQLIEEKIDNQSDNTQRMKEKIDKLKMQIESFNLDCCQKLQGTILNMVKKIDLFKQVDILEIINDSLPQYQNQNEEQQSSIKVIQDLIQNPTNYCTDKFLNQINQYLHNYQNIFNSMQFDGDIFNQEKKQIFSKLSIQELQDLSDLAKNVQNIQDKYKENGEDISKLSNTIQFNSQCVFNHLSKIYEVNCKKLERLLMKYPIFDSLSKFEENQISKIQFIKALNFLDSQNQSITRTNDNHIQIQKSISDKHAVSYTDFIIDPKKKYVFRIKIQTNNSINNNINIGLIEDFYKDKIQIYNKGLCYSESGKKIGIRSKIKGGNVFGGDWANIDKEIEFRIHLENQLLQVSDYPDYQNVAELFDKSLLDDVQYRFGTHLLKQQHKIIITCFAIVEEFNNYM